MLCWKLRPVVVRPFSSTITAIMLSTDVLSCDCHFSTASAECIVLDALLACAIQCFAYACLQVRHSPFSARCWRGKTRWGAPRTSMISQKTRKFQTYLFLMVRSSTIGCSCITVAATFQIIANEQRDKANAITGKPPDNIHDGCEPFCNSLICKFHRLQRFVGTEDDNVFMSQGIKQDPNEMTPGHIPSLQDHISCPTQRKVPCIFYCTRTHSQIAQVIRFLSWRCTSAGASLHACG